MPLEIISNNGRQFVSSLGCFTPCDHLSFSGKWFGGEILLFFESVMSCLLELSRLGKSITMGNVVTLYHSEGGIVGQSSLSCFHHSPLLPGSLVSPPAPSSVSFPPVVKPMVSWIIRLFQIFLGSSMCTYVLMPTKALWNVHTMVLFALSILMPRLGFWMSVVVRALSIGKIKPAVFPVPGISGSFPSVPHSSSVFFSFWTCVVQFIWQDLSTFGPRGCCSPSCCPWLVIQVPHWWIMVLACEVSLWWTLVLSHQAPHWWTMVLLPVCPSWTVQVPHW